jgi:hypothetical protein
VLVQRARTDAQPGPPQRWSAPQWMEWQRDSKSFEALAGNLWSFNFIVSDEGSESLEGMFVSKDFFKVLGLKPLLGRTFQDSETAFPAGDVIILGYELWQRKFKGDPKIVGRRFASAAGRRRRRSSASCRQGSGSCRRQPPRRSRTITSMRPWTSGCPSH